MTSDVHWCVTVFYQQIDNGNIANQIHEFTIDYGKCTLMKYKTSHLHPVLFLKSKIILTWFVNLWNNQPVPDQHGRVQTSSWHKHAVVICPPNIGHVWGVTFVLSATCPSMLQKTTMELLKRKQASEESDPTPIAIRLHVCRKSNTERSFMMRLRSSGCQSQIPTDCQCPHLIGLFTQV